jgi:anti-sigma regulatory factor (Ser/Thr protein kinase)
MRVPRDRSAAAQARHFVRDTLGEWGIDGDVLDDCQLLVSELVTNSILHARSDAVVSLERSAESLRVSVCDASSVAPERRECGPGDIAGRGLLLVERLAQRWGWSPTGAANVCGSRSTRELLDHEQVDEAGDLEHSHHSRRGLPEYEFLPGGIGALLGLDEQADAGRVDEVDPRQVDDDRRGSAIAEVEERVAQRCRSSDVELAGNQHDRPGHVAGAVALDGHGEIGTLVFGHARSVA